MTGQYREQFSEPRLRDALALLMEDYVQFKDSPCEFQSKLRIMLLHERLWAERERMEIGKQR